MPTPIGAACARFASLNPQCLLTPVQAQIVFSKVWAQLLAGLPDGPARTYGVAMSEWMQSEPTS